MTHIPHIRRRSRREGFSLIELLINLAIVGALIGIAVPFYQEYIYSAQKSRTGLDLDVYKGAIARYESKEGHYLATELKPLLGGFLSELSFDPWGNTYFIDGGLGVVGSFGADGILYGEDQDGDLTRHYKPYLSPQRFRYYGGVGIPNKDNRLEIDMNKVFDFYLGLRDQAPNDIVLLKGVDEMPILLGQLGFVIDNDRTDPLAGVLALKCCHAANPNDVHRVPISGDDHLDFAGFVVSFTETPVFPSPLWDSPDQFLLGPKPASGPENRSGIKLSLVNF